MATHKIPTFLSKKFNSASAQQKKAILMQLESWRESALTQALLDWAEQGVQHDETSEDKASFATEFETMQDYAWHKGNRHALRSIVKQLERDE